MKTNEIKKYQFIKFLEIFKRRGCKTIEDVINLLNEEVKDDDRIILKWREH